MHLRGDGQDPQRYVSFIAVALLSSEVSEYTEVSDFLLQLMPQDQHSSALQKRIMSS